MARSGRPRGGHESAQEGRGAFPMGCGISRRYVLRDGVLTEQPSEE